MQKGGVHFAAKSITLSLLLLMDPNPPVCGLNSAMTLEKNFFSFFMSYLGTGDMPENTADQQHIGHDLHMEGSGWPWALYEHLRSEVSTMEEILVLLKSRKICFWLQWIPALKLIGKIFITLKKRWTGADIQILFPSGDTRLWISTKHVFDCLRVKPNLTEVNQNLALNFNEPGFHHYCSS